MNRVVDAISVEPVKPDATVERDYRPTTTIHCFITFFRDRALQNNISVVVRFGCIYEIVLCSLVVASSAEKSELKHAQRLIEPL